MRSANSGWFLKVRFAVARDWRRLWAETVSEFCESSWETTARIWRRDILAWDWFRSESACKMAPSFLAEGSVGGVGVTSGALACGSSATFSQDWKQRSPASKGRRRREGLKEIFEMGGGKRDWERNGVLLLIIKGLRILFFLGLIGEEEWETSRIFQKQEILRSINIYLAAASKWYL